MKNWKIGIATVAVTLSLAMSAAIAQAQETTAPADAQTPVADSQQQPKEHKFEKALQYYLEYNPDKTAEDFEKLRPWLKPFSDVELMADMMADPRTLMEWMNQISEPEAVYLMMKCSQEPVMWDTWMNGMTDTNKLFGAMGRVLVNPDAYVNWVVGWFDTDLYKSMAGMMDPRKLVRWGEHGMRSEFYSPMYAFLKPDYYPERSDWLFDPQSFQPMLNIFAIPQFN